MRRLAVQVAFIWIAAVGVLSAQTLDGAKALFERYVQLEKTFDAAAADLYADDAIIRNKRTYPNGQVRELTFPAVQYKSLIRQAMPIAKARGDTNSYSDITYTREGSGVRIRATRFSNLKKYSSPISLLVTPGSDGRWLIREELSESQP
jgi:hypothetical protein